MALWILVGGTFIASALSSCAKTEALPNVQYQVIRNFEKIGSDPIALFESADGFWYGGFMHGGRRWEGAVFRMRKDGSDYTVLHHFTGSREKGDGSWLTGLIEASDGMLYGVTQRGGNANVSELGDEGGTIFKVDKEGSGYQVLYRFSGGESGFGPRGGLVEGKDRLLYGTTEGGKYLSGTIFKLGTDGTGFKIVHEFGATPGDGAMPTGRLLLGSDGLIYGITVAGGDSGPRNGTAFRFNPASGEIKILHHFPSRRKDGRMPSGGLIEGPDGTLYGTTEHGGENDAGTVFRMQKDGNDYRVLRSFSGSTDPKKSDDGYAPQGLVLERHGILYGTTQAHGPNGRGTLFRMNVDGRGFAVVHAFGINETDGTHGGELCFGSDGVLYGITESSSMPNPHATYFKVTFSETE